MLVVFQPRRRDAGRVPQPLRINADAEGCRGEQSRDSFAPSCELARRAGSGAKRSGGGPLTVPLGEAYRPRFGQVEFFAFCPEADVDLRPQVRAILGCSLPVCSTYKCLCCLMTYRHKCSNLVLAFSVIGMTLIVSALAWAQTPVAGKETVPSTVAMPDVPSHLQYLFDLPWCTRWRFTCMSCEKTGSEIKCFDQRTACNEQFKFYHCEVFNPPEDCAAWRDGCNFCTEKSCTLMSCPEYLAPNKPSFWCYRYEKQ